jgi:predicted glycogen debranching enzyme
MLSMTPVRIFGTQVCGSLAAGTEREWLAADGQGGFAMGTVAGLRTRRYHGLLVTSLGPVARRRMALASLDPVVVLPSGARVELATHTWTGDLIAPHGHTLLERFELRDGLPSWRWRIGDTVLERSLAFARPGPSRLLAARTAGGAATSGTLVVVHRLLCGPPIGLEIEPLCTWRDAHGERSEAEGLRVESTSDGFVVEDSYRVAGPGFVHDGQWYLGVYAREEAARGLPATEDLFRPGRFTGTLRPGEAMEIAAWAGDPAALGTQPPRAERVIEVARSRHRSVVAAAKPVDATAAELVLAADAFVVTDATSLTPDVVAGYPWFGAWSRDTMIAYDGLFLATGRADEGRALLRAYAATLSEGMLANTSDGGSVEHNTADATLWLLHAVGRHVRATGDTDLGAELVDALDGVVTAHLAGTRYGIQIDPADGLLTQGGEGLALTWMDAVVAGVPVTPRRGKAVELNALWVNGLGVLADLRAAVGREHSDVDKLRTTAVEAFTRRFPNPHGWLYDTVDGPDGDDAALRPNQLFAVGLPYAPMPQARDSVAAVGQRLLTPLGLRTLDPSAPGYRGTHRGTPAERDVAYHQGTVWPWLIGSYVDAARAVGLSTVGVLDGLAAHLGEWGVGSVSETADGDAPHAATGCPFQAWSVAELLRAWQSLTG